MKAKPSRPTAKQARPVRRDGVQAATNWLPVPVKWPVHPGWNQPQQIRIQRLPSWTRPGLTLLRAPAPEGPAARRREP